MMLMFSLYIEVLLRNCLLT